LLKLDLQVSLRSVRKYLPEHSGGGPVIHFNVTQHPTAD
jgi:hypothetical protein